MACGTQLCFAKVSVAFPSDVSATLKRCAVDPQPPGRLRSFSRSLGRASVKLISTHPSPLLTVHLPQRTTDMVPRILRNKQVHSLSLSPSLFYTHTLTHTHAEVKILTISLITYVMILFSFNMTLKGTKRQVLWGILNTSTKVRTV